MDGFHPGVQLYPKFHLILKRNHPFVRVNLCFPKRVLWQNRATWLIVLPYNYYFLKSSPREPVLDRSYNYYLVIVPGSTGINVYCTIITDP